jgi:hypothetical protein
MQVVRLPIHLVNPPCQSNLFSSGQRKRLLSLEFVGYHIWGTQGGVKCRMYATRLRRSKASVLIRRNCVCRAVGLRWRWGSVNKVLLSGSWLDLARRPLKIGRSSCARLLIDLSACKWCVKMDDMTQPRRLLISHCFATTTADCEGISVPPVTIQLVCIDTKRFCSACIPCPT